MIQSKEKGLRKMTRQSVQSWFLLLSCIIVLSRAWAPRGSFLRWSLPRDSNVLEERRMIVSSENDGTEMGLSATRRGFLASWTMTVGVMMSAGSAGSALAATDSTVEGGSKTIYKSGKTPIVPGAKPKDKSDVKGTRKDPDFLRSVADCRNACQNTPGSDGYARSKEDCLSECQDICCRTYEQCTFDIVPRI